MAFTYDFEYSDRLTSGKYCKIDTFDLGLVKLTTSKEHCYFCPTGHRNGYLLDYRAIGACEVRFYQMLNLE